MTSFKHLVRVDKVKDTILLIQKNLQCPICLELLSDPFMTRCSHAFCRACICTVISTSKKARCPLCKQAITKRSLNESARLGEIVEAVKALDEAFRKDIGEEICRIPVPYSSHSCDDISVMGPNTNGVFHSTPQNELEPSRTSVKRPCGEDQAFSMMGTRSDHREVSNRQSSAKKVRRAASGKKNTQRGRDDGIVHPLARPALLHELAEGSLMATFNTCRDPSGQAMSGDVTGQLELVECAQVTPTDGVTWTPTDGVKIEDVSPPGQLVECAQVTPTDGVEIEDVSPPGQLELVECAQVTPTDGVEIEDVSPPGQLAARDATFEAMGCGDSSSPLVDQNLTGADQSNRARVTEKTRVQNCAAFLPVTVVEETPLVSTGAGMLSSATVLVNAEQADTGSEDPVLVQESPLLQTCSTVDRVIIEETQVVVGDGMMHSSAPDVAEDQASALIVVEGAIKVEDQTVACSKVEEQSNALIRAQEWISAPCIVQDEDTHSPCGGRVVGSNTASPACKSQVLLERQSPTIPLQNQLRDQSTAAQCRNSKTDDARVESTIVMSSQPSPKSVTLCAHLPGLSSLGTDQMVPPVQGRELLDILHFANTCAPANYRGQAGTSPTQSGCPLGTVDYQASVWDNNAHSSAVLNHYDCDAVPTANSLAVVPDSLLQRENPSLQRSPHCNVAERDSAAALSEDPISDEFTSQDVQTLQKKLEEKQREIEELEALLKMSKADGIEELNHCADANVADSEGSGPLKRPTLPARALSTQRSPQTGHDLLAKADELLKLLRQPPVEEPQSEDNITSAAGTETALSAFCNHSTPTKDDSLLPQEHLMLCNDDAIQVPTSDLTIVPFNSRLHGVAPQLLQSGMHPTITRVILGDDDVETESPPDVVPILPDSHPFMSISSIRRTSQVSAPWVLPRYSPSKVSSSSGKTVTTNRGNVASPSISSPLKPLNFNIVTPAALRDSTNLSRAKPTTKASQTLPLSLVGSGLSRMQLQQVRTFAKKHGGRLAACFNGSTTHIIVCADENHRCSRTLKYLQGVAAGCWVVDYQWVRDSIENMGGALLPESAYEVKGDHLYCLNAPMKARISRRNKEAGLFAHKNFMVLGDCTPLSSDQVRQLIQLAEGKVVSKPQSCIVICDTHPPAGNYSPGTTIVSSNWVLDSLSQYKLLSVREYLVKKV